MASLVESCIDSIPLHPTSVQTRDRDRVKPYGKRALPGNIKRTKRPPSFSTRSGINLNPPGPERPFSLRDDSSTNIEKHTIIDASSFSGLSQRVPLVRIQAPPQPRRRTHTSTTSSKPADTIEPSRSTEGPCNTFSFKTSKSAAEVSTSPSSAKPKPSLIPKPTFFKKAPVDEHRPLLTRNISAAASTSQRPTAACSCSTCDPSGTGGERDRLALYDLHTYQAPRSPPSQRSINSMGKPTKANLPPFLSSLATHANLLLQSHHSIPDIVRALHDNPSLVKYRHLITEQSVWEALRPGLGKQPPSLSSLPLPLDAVLLPPRGLIFEQRCTEYWFASDMPIAEIANAMSQSGFGGPRDGRVLNGDVVLALSKGGITGGKELGGTRIDIWCPEARRIVRKGFKLGMSVSTALQFVHEEGFGRVEEADVETERWNLDAEIRRSRR